MSMIKKGTTRDRIVISSTIYVCKCGHTEINKVEANLCPKCGELMSLVSAQSDTTKDKKEDGIANG